MADVDDSLRNVDNVYTMRDGRVICCEDGWRGGNRSYPNDGMYVYQPPESAQQLSQDNDDGSDGESDDSGGEETAATDGAEGTATDAEAPGFGVLGGAAGVAGAGYLLKRGLDDERE